MRGGTPDPAFEDWKRTALSAEMVPIAQRLGAKLKRFGREWVGPCPVCGGRDTFAINVAKRVFVCRKGQSGGNVISMVRHINGSDFIGACTFLAGPRPGGREESDHEREKREAELARRRRDADRQDEARQASEARRRRSVREHAYEIWRSGIPILGTLGERYLRNRGIDYALPVFPSLRFVKSLAYPEQFGGGAYGCILGAVTGPDGKFMGIWRTYLGEDGQKAPVENAKLAMGPIIGGGVVLGKIGESVDVVEGLETGLGVLGIQSGGSGQYPNAIIISCSTAGMSNWIPPPVVKRARIWPDGDTMKFRNGRMLPRAGMTAADGLRNRIGDQVKTVIQRVAENGDDFLDIYLRSKAAADS